MSQEFFNTEKCQRLVSQILAYEGATAVYSYIQNLKSVPMEILSESTIASASDDVLHAIASDDKNFGELQKLTVAAKVRGAIRKAGNQEWKLYLECLSDEQLGEVVNVASSLLESRKINQQNETIPILHR